MEPGYYWVSIKDIYNDKWKDPAPKYFDQDMIDIVLDGAYDERTVQVIEKILEPHQSERLKWKLYECQKNNEVLKRRLVNAMSCVKGY